MAWTFQHVARLKYDRTKDPKRSDHHYVWEGSGGFGVRLYRTGRKVWVQSGSRWSPARNKWCSYVTTLGVVGAMDLKQARDAAQQARAAAEGQDESEAAAELTDTTLQTALDFYLTTRNCADSSKRDLKSAITAHAGKLLSAALLRITANQVRQVYDGILESVSRREKDRAAQLASMTAEQRLSAAPPGYYTGVKAGANFVECVQRVWSYWVKSHAVDLHAAGISVPPCPTVTLRENLAPQPQRVKAVPVADLSKLLRSLKTYEGNPLHPLLVRFLLATGQRVGVSMGLRWEWVQKDRIVIPADAEAGKVRWRKRHLSYMAKQVPITTEVAAILKALRRLSPLYGELGKQWVFPSRESKAGHLVEEKAAVKALRQHSTVRFSAHQLRHVVASTAEELGYAKSEIAELLGHERGGDVTARYIDDQLERHKLMLRRIGGKLKVVGIRTKRQ